MFRWDDLCWFCVSDESLLCQKRLTAKELPFLEQIRWALSLSEHAWEFDGLLGLWCGQVRWTPYCCSGSDAKAPQDSRRQEAAEEEEEKKLREDRGCAGEAP